MKKLFDFDGFFDKKLAVYMKENAGKYTSAQWEALIPKLYKKFGETYLKNVGAKPCEYYLDLNDEELVKTLALHFEEGVPVSDFLCREIERRKPACLLPLLLSENEPLAETALSLSDKIAGAVSVCFEILKGEFPEARKERARELIRENAQEAKEFALDALSCGVEPDFMLETLSFTEKRDKRVLDALLSAFKAAGENLQMYAGFLATYGDEAALPTLKEALGREELNYLEYREIRYAFEALGGEIGEERDFSNDPYFAQIKQQSEASFALSEEEARESSKKGS